MAIDRDKLMRRTKAQIIDDLEVELDDQDKVRQRQIRKQVDSMQRFMRGTSDVEEVARLQEQIVELEQRLEMALQENRRLKGEPTAAINIGLKLRRPS